MITELLYLNLTHFQLHANLIVLLLTKCVGWVWRLCEGSWRADRHAVTREFGKVGAPECQIFFETRAVSVCSFERPLCARKREGINVGILHPSPSSSSFPEVVPNRQREAGWLLLPPWFLGLLTDHKKKKKKNYNRVFFSRTKPIMQRDT